MSADEFTQTLLETIDYDGATADIAGIVEGIAELDPRSAGELIELSDKLIERAKAAGYVSAPNGGFRLYHRPGTVRWVRFRTEEGEFEVGPLWVQVKVLVTIPGRRGTRRLFVQWSRPDDPWQSVTISLRAD